jgi:uncharacterized repeat protein (TIGR01451 family)
VPIKINNTNINIIHMNLHIDIRIRHFIKTLFCFLIMISFLGLGNLLQVQTEAKVLQLGTPGFNPKYNTQKCVVPIDIVTKEARCNVVKFRNTDGKLLEVRVKFTGNTTVDTQAENRVNTPNTVKIQTTTTMIVTDPNTKDELVVVVPQVTIEKSLATYDGITDYAGASGFSEMGRKGTDTKSMVYTPTSFGNLYNLFLEGSTGADVKLIKANSQNQIIGPGNYGYQGYVSNDLVFEIDYVYEAYDVTIEKTTLKNVFTIGEEADYKIAVTNKETVNIVGGARVQDTLPSYLTFVSVTPPDTNWVCDYASATRIVKCDYNNDFPASYTGNIMLKVKVESPTLINEATNTAKIDLQKYVDINYSDNNSTKKNPVNNPPETYDCTIPTKLVNTEIIFNSEALLPICLRGTDPDPADYVASYTINTLPNPTYGALYINNPIATDPATVSVNTVLTPEQITRLLFRPVSGYIGGASFTYSSTDSFGLKDKTPATVKLDYSNPDVFITKTALGTKPYMKESANEFEIKFGLKNFNYNGPIEITDTLPKEMEYISMENGSGLTCSVTGQDLKCLGTKNLVVGESYPIKIKYKFAKDFYGTVDNTAKIKQITGETFLDDNQSTANFPVITADLKLDKGVDYNADKDDFATWKLTVTNVGDYKFENQELVIIDSLPENVEYVSSLSSDWVCKAMTKQKIECKSIKTLAKNDKAVLLLKTKVIRTDKEQKLDNVANLTILKEETDPNNNKDNEVIKVPAKIPDILIPLVRTGGIASIMYWALFTTLVGSAVIITYKSMFAKTESEVEI